MDLVLIKCGSPENPWGDDGPPSALLRASRRIEVGEELTWNYNLKDGKGNPLSSMKRNENSLFQCQCQAENCKKFWFYQ